MSAERKPEVVDLSQYKKARADAVSAEAAKAKSAAKAAAPKGESLLGSRPRAGLILAAVVLLLAVLFVLPRML